jgi:hypothetical protein
MNSRAPTLRANALYAGITALLSLPALVLLWLAQFNRGMSDDFCFTRDALGNGLVGAVQHFYATWSGTYTGVFIQSAIGFAGAWVITPFVAIIGMALALFWAGYQALGLLGVRRPALPSALMAAALHYGWLVGHPSFVQGIFWTSGAVTYAFSATVIVANLGLLLWIARTSRHTAGPLALSALLAFLAAGFSPLPTVMMLAMWALLLAAVWLTMRGALRRRWLGLVGLNAAFTAMGFALLLASPGNAVRQAAFETGQTLLESLVQAGIGALLVIPMLVRYTSAFSLLLPFAIAALIAYQCQPLSERQRQMVRRHALRWMALIALAAFTLIWAGYFASTYAINLLPAARAYSILLLPVVLASAAWGYLIGLRARDVSRATLPRWARLAGGFALGAMLLFGPVREATTLLGYAPDFAVFAADWDARDAVLRQASGNPADPPPLTVELADYAGLEPYDVCIRDYYRLLATPD